MPPNHKNQNKDPALVYFDGKFNSKAGLFSSTFWFEHSFGCHLALLAFRPYSTFVSCVSHFWVGFKPILENHVFRAVSEPFLLLYGRKTKSAKWHPKECSNQKVEENKPALELNFPSKYTRAGSYNWNWIPQRALICTLSKVKIGAGSKYGLD